MILKTDPIERAKDASSCRTKRWVMMELFRKPRTEFAVFIHYGGGYICAQRKYSPLFDYAKEHGLNDPDFFGFYKGPEGWQCFIDDANDLERAMGVWA